MKTRLVLLGLWVMLALGRVDPLMGHTLMSQTLVIAHRGASAVAPENTLVAFEAAIGAGSDFVELDVHLTVDDEVIVIHDDDVDRTTDGSGAVREMTLAQLKALDAGSWFGSEFAGEPLPTLGEALDLMGGRVRILVELKDPVPGDHDRGRHEAVLRAEHELSAAEVDRSRTLVDRCLAAVDARGLGGQVMFQTFYPENLKALRAAMKARPRQTRIPYGFLYDYADRRHQAVLYGLWHRAAAFNPALRNATRSQMILAHLVGMKSFVYTVDDVDGWVRARALRVDGIITNRPRALRQHLGPAAGRVPLRLPLVPSGP